MTHDPIFISAPAQEEARRQHADVFLEQFKQVKEKLYTAKFNKWQL